jgi:hypothetical protein
MTQPSDQPYCRECGYSLIGLTESSKCPECGRPIVEVLVRDSFPGRQGYRYESKERLWGLPFISIASGPHGEEKVGRPVGVIAIGDFPKGVIAIGSVAVGGIAIGGVAVGGISLGGLGVGLAAFGGVTVGLFAVGGFAVGLAAIGGMVFTAKWGFGGQVFHIRPWW